MEAIETIGTIIASRSTAADSEAVDRDLEAKIAALGLFPHEAWSLRHFPVELHSDCGRGLGIWQYPNQLLPLLIVLQEYRIESYLEIGVAAGGTFTLLCELLAAWCEPGTFRAMGCDPARAGCVAYLSDNPYQEGFRAWLAANSDVEYVQAYSEQLERRFAREGKENPTFDCVLVDGDHSYEGAWADLEMALRFQAGIIILHDVVNSECPGVCQAWAQAQATLHEEFDFVEMSAQYESVQKDEDERFLGIGICIRKTLGRRSPA